MEEVRRERELERVQEATESEMYGTLVEQGRNTQTESRMLESPIEQDNNDDTRAPHSPISDGQASGDGEEVEVELIKKSQEQLDVENEYVSRHDDHAYRVKNSYVPKLLNYSSEGEPNSAPSPLYGSNSDRERSPGPQQDVQYERSEEYVVNEPVELLQIKKEEVEERAVNESTPTREVILEDTESQDGSPVGIVRGLFRNIVRNVIQKPGDHDAARRTPPRVGRLVYEEKVRNTPAKDRRGPTRDERRAAQGEFPVRERIGTNPPAYARPGTSRTR